MLFPTTVVGSMPRPEMVQDLLDPAAPDRLGADAWQARSDASVRFMISMMESTGIDIITDGEWRRRSYTDVFAQMVGGFVASEAPRTPTGTRFFTVVEPLHDHRNFIADDGQVPQGQHRPPDQGLPPRPHSYWGSACTTPRPPKRPIPPVGTS